MLRLKSVIAAVGVALGLWSVSAQDGGGQPGVPNVDKWMQIRAYLENLKTKWEDKKGNLPDRPLPPLPDDVKKMIEDARSAAKDFVVKQKDLAKALKDATDAEREGIRDQMKDNLQAFKDAQKDRVEEIKKRLVEIKDQFRDNHDRLIDAARENANSGRPR